MKAIALTGLILGIAGATAGNKWVAVPCVVLGTILIYLVADKADNQ